MSRLPPEHIAIVGCGFAGTSALWQLVDRHPVRRITVFEASGQFGPGYPYRPDDCPDYLVNNTTDTMCLVPGNRRAFVDWLAQQGPVEPGGHLPRGEYGRFLAEVVRAAQVGAAIKGIAVELVPAEVTAMREDADGLQLHWAGGNCRADAALLTTGRCPDIGPVPPPPPGATARYFGSHIRCEALDALPLDARCHVLGASLSAYDIVNRLFSERTGCRFARDTDGQLQFIAGPNARRVVLCSRSGRLKKMESIEPLPIRRTRLVEPVLRQLAAGGGVTLAALQALVDAEAAAHGCAIDWPAVLQPYAGCTSADALDAQAGAQLAQDIAAARAGGGANFLTDLVDQARDLLWALFAQRWLRPADELQYRRGMESALLCYAAPCPIPTAERLLALHRAGRLAVRAGAQAPVLAPDGSHYAITHRFGVERASVLLNAAGQVDRRLSSPRQGPLLASLRQQGLAHPFRLAGAEADGLDVDPHSYRLAGSRRIYAANMMLWGPCFFTSSAFTMAQVVERALAALYPGAVRN